MPGQASPIGRRGRGGGAGSERLESTKSPFDSLLLAAQGETKPKQKNTAALLSLVNYSIVSGDEEDETAEKLRGERV